jgi:hypothetical protein
MVEMDGNDPDIGFAVWHCGRRTSRRRCWLRRCRQANRSGRGAKRGAGSSGAAELFVSAGADCWGAERRVTEYGGTGHRAARTACDAKLFVQPRLYESRERVSRAGGAVR